MPYYQGQPVPLPFALADVNGNPVNAVSTAPVLTVTLPDGTTATPSVTNPSVGGYYGKFATTEPGRHTWTWVCTDATYPGALSGAFDVWPLTSTDVLEFTDAKATLSISAANTTWDQEIHEYLAGITSWLEWYCGPIVQQTVTETLTVGGLVVQLSKPPVLSLVTWTQVPASLANQTGFTTALANNGPMFPVMVYGVAYPLANLFVDQEKGWVRHTSGLPFYYGPYMWQYTAGYTVIPYSITYAARVLLRHLWALERGGAGGAGLGAADEEMTPGPMGYMVPNRLLETLAPFQIPAAIA